MFTRHFYLRYQEEMFYMCTGGQPVSHITIVTYYWHNTGQKKPLMISSLACASKQTHVTSALHIEVSRMTTLTHHFYLRYHPTIKFTCALVPQTSPTKQR